MTISTSRQQFLAYETQDPDGIQYERRGGVFLSHCVCAALVVLAVTIAVLVGVVVYFVTYYKLSQPATDFWDESEPFGGLSSAPQVDLRLPQHVKPSFYRLKLKTDLDNSKFTGEVYITIKASKQVKTIVLNSKDLKINENARLTEQIFEKILDRTKRQAENEPPKVETSTIVSSEANGTSIQIDPTTPTAITTENTSTNQSSDSVGLEKTLNVTEDKESKLNKTTQPRNIPETTTSEITTNSLATKTKYSGISETTTNDDIVTSTKRSSLETTTLPPKIEKANPDNTQLTHSTTKDVHILSMTHKPGDKLVISLANQLKVGVDYILQLSFEGSITNNLTGFYKSSYINNLHEEKFLGVTQFEPTSARTAFPCFDEPEFKAKFEISIAHIKNLTVLSNMKVATEEEYTENPNWQWTHFERSVDMSTYLVAYVISDFKSLNSTYQGIDGISKPIKVWSQPELVHNAEYALSVVPKLLKFYENLFGVPYALDKLDIVAIPDFSSEAMENWGLLTFKENYLLLDSNDNIPRDKQEVAICIAHELAHQWVGNLLTMTWWTDLWLNEGFATYMEYVATDQLDPSWQLLERFTQSKMMLLRKYDALKNTSPVSKTVNDASEISQKFNEISYLKGASLIRMLNYTITQELFEKGLQIYVKEWKYKNAEENDLWLAMTAAVQSTEQYKNLSVVKFMNSWTRQAGYPVIYVKRDYSSGLVTMQQSLFTTSQSPYTTMKSQLWDIPVSYSALGSANVHQLWLTDRSVSLTSNMSDKDAIYVNVDNIGYYRVNYDKTNWALIKDALNSGKIQSSITKSQLIDDAFNLAKVSQLDYVYALDLITFLVGKEDSRIVWETVLDNLAFIKHTLRGEPGYKYFQDFVKLLIAKQLEAVKYGKMTPTDDTESFLIENMLSWECMMESPRCLDWAGKLFSEWMAEKDFNINPIPSYLRSLVYSVAIKYGGRREFDYLFGVFTNTTDPKIKNLVLDALPHTREEPLIAALLEKSITDLPLRYSASVWNVQSTAGTKVAQRLLVEHWDRVYSKLGDVDSFTMMFVLQGAFGDITTQDELDTLKSLALKHKSQMLAVSQTLQKLIDMATLRIEWLSKHSLTVVQWMKHYLDEGKSGTTERNDINESPEVPRSSDEVKTKNKNNGSIKNKNENNITKNKNETITDNITNNNNTILDNNDLSIKSKLENNNTLIVSNVNDLNNTNSETNSTENFTTESPKISNLTIVDNNSTESGTKS